MKQLMKKNNIGWLFIIISVIAIGMFYFYPMFDALLLSFQSGMGANLEYTGLSNWSRLFNDPTFIQALINTTTYLMIQVPIMIVLALFFSVLLNDETLKFRGFLEQRFFYQRLHRSLPIQSSLNTCLVVTGLLTNY